MNKTTGILVLALVPASLLADEVILRGGGCRVELETTFADYRPVSGLVWPHLIESRAKGRPRSLRIVVQSIELDPELDDARFRMP